jgi:hypothetical protein
MEWVAHSCNKNPIKIWQLVIPLTTITKMMIALRRQKRKTIKSVIIGKNFQAYSTIIHL